MSSRAGRREWVGLAVIALPCLLYSMDLTVLNLAVRSLTADLRPSSAELPADCDDKRTWKGPGHPLRARAKRLNGKGGGSPPSLRAVAG